MNHPEEVKAIMERKTLNPNAQKWVAALRSGKYVQARNVLKTTDDRYCCLGVACELAKEAGVIDGYSGAVSFLPGIVREWLGLRTHCGTFGNGQALYKENDEGKGFTEIADIIESQPEGLFVKEVTA